MDIAPRTGVLAVAHARGEHRNPTTDWTRRCQEFTRDAFEIGPGARTAIEAFFACPAKLRHENKSAPYGTAGYFRAPAAGKPGHAIVNAGHQRAWSNDIKHAGSIDLTTIEEIERRWGYIWVGWTEATNGVRFYGHGPSISADAVKAAQQGAREHAHGQLLKRQLAGVPGIGRHGMRLTDDRLGHPFDDAVSDLQKRLGLKRTGLVGPRLLGWLADHDHAFTARP